jgi:CDP-diacylglycerol--glycerol-3-phosphate 3-phosphatidyltransferase
MTEAQRAGFVTLPNAISLCRTIIAWIAIMFLWQCLESGDVNQAPFWLAVFVFAVALDALDGWLARSLNVESSVGSYVDIIADRLTEYPAWILLSHVDSSLRGLVLVIVARNLVIDGVKLESVRRGIVMESGVPKMSTFGELLVNHPVNKTAHNILKASAIVLGLAGMLHFPGLRFAAVVVLVVHTAFCLLRGLGSILELPSIWRATPQGRTNGAVGQYVFQCTVGLVVLIVILGGYLV